MRGFWKPARGPQRLPFARPEAVRRQASEPRWRLRNSDGRKPITEGNRTFGEWWAEYEVAPADAESVHQTVSDTFRFAFEGAVKIARQKKS
jgi:hypothetical protein